jgi:reactive intermediate/imine deaminase
MSAEASGNPVVLGILVPGLPHPLLCPEKNEGWARVRAGFEAARDALRAARPDVLLVYSTMWPSVIGHQIQADPEPEWVHVDELFHDLGSIPYKFRIDAGLAEAWRQAALARGLHARTVAYHGFPVDTGSVVALKLLTPENEIPAVIGSSNVYADRVETVLLGKAAVDALRAQGKRAAAVVVSTLSNRLFTDWIDPGEDRIHSPKDDEWNRKVLEFLGDGRLADVAELSREIQRQIRVKKVVNFKPMWWLGAVMGRHNRYEGKVHAYEAVFGTGSAVVTLSPAAKGVGDKEYDEEEVEVWLGDRGVLEGEGGPSGGTAGTRPMPPAETGGSEPKVAARRAARRGAPWMEAPTRKRGNAESDPDRIVRTDRAPRPVGAYPHARRAGELLYLSGIGPRQAGTDAIPGGPIRDSEGNPRDYDVRAQTRACIENVRAILEAAGSRLDRIVDVTAFLVDMQRDFAAYNEVWTEYFEGIQATRTTVEVRALPTPIAVELKAVALAGDGSK